MHYGLLLLASAQIAGILIADRAGVTPRVAALMGCACAVLYWWIPARSSARLGVGLLIAVSAGAYGLGLGLERSTRPVPDLPLDGLVEASVCGGPDRVGESLSVVLCSVRSLPGPGLLPPSSADWLDTVWPDVLLRNSADGPEAERIASLMVGQRIRAYLRLRRPGGLRNPGGMDFARKAARKGIGLQARLLEPDLLVRLPERDAWAINPLRWGPVRDRLMSWRRRASEGLMEAAVGAVPLSTDEFESGGLLAALATGDRSGLSRPVRDAFARLGLSHLLAVSGLHLAMVAGFGYRLALWLGSWLTGLRPARDRRPLALWVGVSSAGGYACLAGFGIPVQRAWIFLVIASLVMGFGRRALGVPSLAAAGIIILAVRPAVVFELGAQLSFAATAGLLTAASLRRHPSEAGFGRSGRFRWLAQSLAASSVAIAVTAPLLAHAGMLVSPVGLLLNLIGIAWTGLFLLPAALAAATMIVVLGEVAMPLVAVARQLARWSIDASLFLAEVWHFLPDHVIVDWAVLWGVGILAILTCREQQPVRALVIALASVLWILGAPAPSIGPGPPRLVMFDVGQGDAILLEGRSAAVLVDGGRAGDGPGFDLGRSVVGPGLNALGVRHLDAVVASHADIDHRGGLRHILEHFDVGELWLPAALGSDPGFVGLRQLAEDRGVSIHEIAAGQPDRIIGDLRFTPLWPLASPIFESNNENSLVLRVVMGGQRILLTGDIGVPSEDWLLEHGTDLDADILKVAHHGSRGSSSPGFLAAVDAEIALLSASCAGLAGLPSERALRRLERSGVQLWWTGREGAVWLALAPDSSRVPARVIWGWDQPRPCRRFGSG